MNHPAATFAQHQWAYDNAAPPDADSECRDCSKCGESFALKYECSDGACPFCGHIEDEMIRALADDLKRQNLALKAELKCVIKLLGKPMLAADVETLTQKCALLIGEEA